MFEQYESYRDSGLHWLGKVPDEWKVKRLKDMALIQYSNVDKKIYDNQKNIFLCNYVDVYKNEFITHDISFMKATASKEEIRKFLLKKDDVLFTKDSESFDDNVNPCLVSESFTNVVCGYHLAQVRVNRKDIVGAYLFRLLQSVQYNYHFAVNSKGITRVGLGMPSVKDAQIFLPPLDTQTKIATYLDQKTQTIDKEINLLEEKIIKYKELKQTLINETVLRGLDKSVKLKESGIEWIGEIPEGWEVKRLKDLGKIETSSVDKKIKENEKLVKIVNYTDVYKSKNKELHNSEDYMIVSANPLQIKSKTLKKGDVLFTPSSETIEDIGVSTVIVENLENTLYSYHILRLRFSENINNNFKKYLFNNQAVQYYFSKFAKGTTRKILGLNHFDNLKVAIPPFEEQVEIANYLDEKTKKIDTISETIEKKIATLKEFRKTLINDVVTGKVKVA